MEKERPTPIPTQLRDATIAAALLAGKSVSEAGRLAYPDATTGARQLATRRLQKGTVQRIIDHAKRRILVKAFRRHEKLLSANSVTPMSTPNGIVRVEVPDNKTRLGAVKLSYEASGLVGGGAAAAPSPPASTLSINLLSGEPPVIIEWVMREGRLPSPQERSVLLSGGPVCPRAPDPPDPPAPRRVQK